MKRNILLFALAAYLLIFPQQSSADFVVNHTITTSEITKEELIQIFFFFKKFESKQGAKLTVVLPPPSSYLFRMLATHELRTSPSQYLASINTRIAEGSASPVFAETEAEVLIKVANIPYSIGYYYDSIKLNDGFGVKTITIK